MRKLFSLFLAIVATTTLWAYDFQSGDLYYNITRRPLSTTNEHNAQRFATTAQITNDACIWTNTPSANS